MPDLRYVFFTDKGIAKFLDEYAKGSGIEGMDEAVRKVSSSRSNLGLKLAEFRDRFYLKSLKDWRLTWTWNARSRGGQF